MAAATLLVTVTNVTVNADYTVSITADLADSAAPADRIATRVFVFDSLTTFQDMRVAVKQWAELTWRQKKWSDDVRSRVAAGDQIPVQVSS